MASRISTLDSTYVTGALSQYPASLDTPQQLYEVSNNAETALTQSLSYNATYLVTEDASAFPPQGLILVGTEIVYYASISGNSFQGLIRGFAGSQQNQWSIGTTVAGSVMAEIHNAAKDAITNIENNLGLEVSPSAKSLNGILTQLENRFLAPKPTLRAWPIQGPAPLVVQFQNFSGGDPIRYLWDFGDGSTSVAVAPLHVYSNEGKYTVTLNMITTLGAQGIVTKTDYIVVDNSLTQGYYYITPLSGSVNQLFTFVDQTLGDIASRYWVFGDGTSASELDPDIHVITHAYTQSGTYSTSEIVVFTDQTLRRYVNTLVVN